jgi:hypothetical protein
MYVEVPETTSKSIRGKRVTNRHVRVVTWSSYRGTQYPIHPKVRRCGHWFGAREPHLLKRHTLHALREGTPNPPNGLGIIPLLGGPSLDKQCEKRILPITQHDSELVPHAPPGEYASRKRLLNRGLVALDGVYELVRFDHPAILRGCLDRLEFERLCVNAFAEFVNAVVREAVVSHEEVAGGNVEVTLGLLSSISTSKSSPLHAEEGGAHLQDFQVLPDSDPRPPLHRIRQPTKVPSNIQYTKIDPTGELIPDVTPWVVLVSLSKRVHRHSYTRQLASGRLTPFQYSLCSGAQPRPLFDQRPDFLAGRHKLRF